MIRSLPKQLTVALALAAAFLAWSLQDLRSQRAAFIESSASLARCEKMLADIREIPVASADRAVAPSGFQPEADVVEAAKKSDIPTDNSFGVSHLAPTPLAGTQFSEVTVDVRPMELTLEQVFAFAMHLAESPVHLNTRRFTLTRAAASDVDSANAESERWTAVFDIYYLTGGGP